MKTQNPPFSLTPRIVDLCAQIHRKIGHLEGAKAVFPSIKLRREQQIKTIQASLAIEGNTLSCDQITALIEGKRIVGPHKDIQEAQNALKAYARIDSFNPLSVTDLLKAHSLMMQGLVDSPGKFRVTGVGVFKGGQIAHIAPPAKQVSSLVENLLRYIKQAKELNFLIKSCICHYELEFIHPFTDGNGRMGRLWQQLLLMKEHALFQFIAIEELVRKNQEKYYEVLGACDKKGDSTEFIEFMLGIVSQTLSQYKPDPTVQPKDALSRLAYAQSHLKDTWFTRREYLAIFHEISTATASRDLKQGVVQKVLVRESLHNRTTYKYAESTLQNNR